MVDRIITDRAILDVQPTGLQVVDLAPGTSFHDLTAITGCPLRAGAEA